MTDHYYSRHPESESDPKEWSCSLRGMSFVFQTDRGVFSKGGVDFGSRLLIETFREPDVDGPILDVGCGYGPIGLALAKSYPGRDIHLIDVNERALHLASENAEKNGIFNVKIYESDRLAQVEVRDFAAIVTNPPIRAGKQIVFRILEESYDHLRAGGELWVVVQKKQGAPSVKNRMEEIFRQVEMVERKKGYHILMAKKGDEEA